MRLTRPTLFLVLGMVFAVLAGVLAYGVTQQAATRETDPFANTTDVVVAKDDIPEMTVLTPAMLTLTRYPNVLLPKGHVPSVDAVVGQTTLVQIPAGAPILTGQVAAVGGATGYSAQLARDQVLVAFTVSDPLLRAPLIKPRDHIDIVATLSPTVVGALATASPGATPPAATALTFPVSQTVVQDLEVVSVIGNDVLIFIVDRQTGLVLKSLRDSGAVIDLFVRSAADPGRKGTTPVDISVIAGQFGFRR